MNSPPYILVGRSRLVACLAISTLAMRVDAQEITLPRVAYGSSGWKYAIVPANGQPGFESPDFDDSDWSVGTAPWGTGGYCSLPFQMVWAINTDLLVRRMVDVPPSGRLRIAAKIDNDLIVHVNGMVIGPWATFDGCGGAERFSATTLPLVGGPVRIAIRARDRGGESHFDARVEVVFDADCDGDGTVDYGQILRGEVPDLNSNGVPDGCECPADIDRDGRVAAEDLAEVLFAWGLTGAKVGDADVNRDDHVDGSDLSAVLATWGPCPD